MRSQTALGMFIIALQRLMMKSRQSLPRAFACRKCAAVDPPLSVLPSDRKLARKARRIRVRPTVHRDESSVSQ